LLALKQREFHALLFANNQRLISSNNICPGQELLAECEAHCDKHHQTRPSAVISKQSSRLVRLHEPMQKSTTVEETRIAIQDYIILLLNILQ
jgi:hypothetical protein